MPPAATCVVFATPLTVTVTKSPSLAPVTAPVTVWLVFDSAILMILSGVILLTVITGAGGGVVSITTTRLGEAADSLLSASDSVNVTVCEPSPNADDATTVPGPIAVQAAVPRATPSMYSVT